MPLFPPRPPAPPPPPPKPADVRWVAALVGVLVTSGLVVLMVSLWLFTRVDPMAPAPSAALSSPVERIAAS